MKKEKPKEKTTEKKEFTYQKTSKSKPLTVFIICKNTTIKEYDIFATRKFNLQDETYVVKEKCCYQKNIDGEIKLVSYYNQGNPNPIKLKKGFKNIGLTSNELDSYISADIFNIIAECQQNDRSKYILGIVGILFIFAFINFMSTFF